MKQIRKQQENLKNELLPHLKGSLTSSSLSAMLDVVRTTAQKQLGVTSEQDKQEIVACAKEYIAPKNLKNGNLTPEMVIHALALTVLIDEYLMTLTSLPALKSQLWAEVEKDGLTFNIWANIQEASQSSEQV